MISLKYLALHSTSLTLLQSRTVEMGKGKAYLAEEDVALCRAWMRVSEDPITGSEQKADCFWQAVHKLFRGYGPGDDEGAFGTWDKRNPNALRHR